MEPYLLLELHTIVLAVLAVGAWPVHDSMDHWMCIITDRNEYKFSPIHQKLKFEIGVPCPALNSFTARENLVKPK